MEKVGIIAFAFGVPWTILSNQRIAAIASKKAIELDGRIYTQADIFIEEDSILVDYTQEEFGNPPPTLRIARGAVRWARQHKLTELWVVAAKPHLWRALRDVVKAVREAKLQIKVYACKKEVDQYPEDSWFCPASKQYRVRSRKEWDKRERILKLLPFFIYKHIAI